MYTPEHSSEQRSNPDVKCNKSMTWPIYLLSAEIKTVRVIPLVQIPVIIRSYHELAWNAMEQHVVYILFKWMKYSLFMCSFVTLGYKLTECLFLDGG